MGIDRIYLSVHKMENESDLRVQYIRIASLGITLSETMYTGRTIQTTRETVNLLRVLYDAFPICETKLFSA